MAKYVDINAAKEAVRRAECDADWDERRFDAEFIENALDFIPRRRSPGSAVQGLRVQLGGHRRTDVQLWLLCRLHRAGGFLLRGRRTKGGN